MEPGAGIEPAWWDYESHACIRLGYTVARKVPSGITVLLTRLNLMGKSLRTTSFEDKAVFEAASFHYKWNAALAARVRSQVLPKPLQLNPSRPYAIYR